MTKKPLKKSKTKPKPTIASLQKEVRALKRTISEQNQVIRYVQRQSCEISSMLDAAEAEIIALRRSGKTNSQKGN